MEVLLKLLRHRLTSFDTFCEMLRDDCRDVVMIDVKQRNVLDA